MKLKITGLFETLLFSAVFMLFINGQFGWILIYSTAAAYIISIAVCIASRKHFEASCGSFSGVYRKGETITAELKFTRKGFCLLPFITVNGSFSGEPFTARCGLLKNTAKVKISLKAAECTLNKLEIHEIILRDLLGVIYLKAPVLPEICTAAVLPAITDYNGPAVMPSPLPSDNDEEEETVSVDIAGSLPGYENRDYIPGDSPRKINYKLSAKKQKLLVRKNENASAERVDIIIAPGADGGCAEQALALATRLISMGGSARVICGKDSFSAASAAGAAQLREWLAFRDLPSIQQLEAERRDSVYKTAVTIYKDKIVLS